MQLPNLNLAELLSKFAPPAWLVAEVQQKIVLFINHVLDAEPEALRKLALHAGKRVQIVWQPYDFKMTFEVAISPMGLLELVPAQGEAPKGSIVNLRLTLQEPSATQLVKKLSQKLKPDLHMEGDVALASEINWLLEHVRWDAFADLSRFTSPSVAGWAEKAFDATMGKVREGFNTCKASAATTPAATTTKPAAH